MTKTEQDQSVPLFARYQQLGWLKDVRPVVRATDYAIIIFYPDDQRTWLYSLDDVQRVLAELHQREGTIQ
jgi:hypothetical protein